MKTRRRIEIRTIRRRTAVILRGQPAGEHVGPPPLQAAASHTVAADSTRPETAEPEQSQIKQLSQGNLSPTRFENNFSATDPEAE